jgi:glycosyltransferase involved in cell wall biosynthesis
VRVAILNWAPIKDGPKEGGGVSIYAKNLADELARRGCDVSFISLGYYYDLHGRVSIRSERIEKIDYIDVLNSPVLAPSALMFGALSEVVQSLASDAMIRMLLHKCGPFDVVHIQNIEGFSFSALKIIRDALPKARLILTCHNYHVICQQANLWAQNSRRCIDFNHGAECVTCNIASKPVLKTIAKRWISKLPRFYQKIFGFQLRLIFKWNAKFRHLRFMDWGDGRLQGGRPSADSFACRRAQALKYVNEFCDRVICVSETVRDVMIRHGAAQESLACCYIGTAHFRPARMRARATNNLRKKGEITIAFLGYMQPHKGFNFLLEAFEQMPQALGGKINLRVAAKNGDRATMERLARLNAKFKSFDIRDGYLQSELEEILEDVDIGLVTPMWDDALPQVAIEFVCHGVPILVSDRGGQKELAVDSRFIFDGSSIADFWRKLSAIYDDPSLIGEFWYAERPLRTNAMHVDELMHFYREH